MGCTDHNKIQFKIWNLSLVVFAIPISNFKRTNFIQLEVYAVAKICKSKFFKKWENFEYFQILLFFYNYIKFN